jgi:hypothetical protein
LRQGDQQAARQTAGERDHAFLQFRGGRRDITRAASCVPMAGASQVDRHGMKGLERFFIPTTIALLEPRTVSVRKSPVRNL